MGRKKRKASTEAQEGEGDAAASVAAAAPQQQQQQQQQLPPGDPRARAGVAIKQENVTIKAPDDESQPVSSGYAMTSHSAEIIGEDIYVSDGSDDSSVEGDDGAGEAGDDGDNRGMDIILSGSRMGLMRRGLTHSMLVQPKRQWVRQEAAAAAKDGGDENDEQAEKKRKQEEEEELAKLDPSQRAAKLLAEKQRKLEEAKENARRLESEENAGRDPCLFSKRTAFDIRFDQIDDKPWTRGAGDLTDFFNYGLTEDDWLEYSQQQLMIRQELTDASRQRRVPDPAIVPVKPRSPTTQTPKVAVNASSSQNGSDDGAGSEIAPVAGPEFVKSENPDQVKEEADDTPSIPNIHVGAGGAWGAGAPPGSVLAKLIEEQEQKNRGGGYGGGGNSVSNNNNNNNNNNNGGVKQEFASNNHYGDRGHSGHRERYDDNFGGGNQWGGPGQDYGRGGRDYGSYGGRGGGRGGGGGRGYDSYHHGGRGGRGFAPNPSWGGRGDYQSRKRSRDDYGGGQW